MRWTAVLGLVALIGCGGGAVYDPVTHVALSAAFDFNDRSGHPGWTSWDDRGSKVLLADNSPLWARLPMLKHELWHLLTRFEWHRSGLECVSSGDGSTEWWDHFAQEDSVPCAEEVAEVNAAGRTVTLSFPADPECARAAAAWWNDAVGYEAVVVD